jgi:Histidine kinase-, DNA gyrase B-, and HSP90-like ATPase
VIPNAVPREITAQGVTHVAEFGISRADEAHIMTILRDTLYTDKVLAVIREYSSNAWDANRESGKTDVPIEVTLPTPEEPTLVIKDRGPGLAQEDVFAVYTQYGASTKRGNNNSVGMLGIGCKSAFAYSDSFTIVSCHGGMRRIYTAVLDSSEKGVIQQLAEEPCGDETGVTIKIAVRQEDIHEFTKKAEKVYMFFDPRPTINVELPSLPSTQTELPSGVIFDRFDMHHEFRGWVAVMGCVAYRIDLEQLETPESRIPRHIREMTGALHFKVGEVTINASREELKYSTQTKKVLRERFDTLVDEYVQKSLKDIEAKAKTPWERRGQLQVFRQLCLPIPLDLKPLIEGHVKFPEKDKFPAEFVAYQMVEGEETAVESVTIHSSSRFMIRDDKRSYKGYAGINGREIYVRAANADTTMDEVEKSLLKLLDDLGLTGIPVIKMSSLHWESTSKAKQAVGRTLNPKHKVRTFVFTPTDKFIPRKTRTRSASWSPVMRTPEKTDVYVLLERFEATCEDFIAQYVEDTEMAALFGIKLPAVYGYKTTEKIPVDVSEEMGVLYPEWRTQFVKELSKNPKVIQMLEDLCWYRSLGRDSYHGTYARFNKNTVRKDYKKIIDNLGAKHPIAAFYRNYVKALRTMGSYDYDKHSRIEKLEMRLKGMVELKYPKVLEAMYLKYPLLSLLGIGVQALIGEKASTWSTYIKTVDNLFNLTQPAIQGKP